MAFVVLLAIAVAVVLLVVRATAAAGADLSPPGTERTPRPARRPRPSRSAQPVAPDDDPDFIRELGRRVRRDDGSPA